MNVNSITLLDLNTGETVDLTGTLPNTKFAQRGHKMYNYGIVYMLDKFTNTEIKRTISLFATEYIDYNNILTCKISKPLADMDPSHRSKLKRKLIDHKVIQEYNGKVMVNPYIFVPRGDKNIHNSQYLTQRVWKYLFEDANIGSDEVIKHAELLFGKLPSSKYLLVGSGDYTKLVEKPNEQS